MIELSTWWYEYLYIDAIYFVYLRYIIHLVYVFLINVGN